MFKQSFSTGRSLSEVSFLCSMGTGISSIAGPGGLFKLPPVIVISLLTLFSSLVWAEGEVRVLDGNEAGTVDLIHIYKNTGDHSFEVPDGVTEVEYLVVGGGGAGGSGVDDGVKGTGGGGAGGLLSGTHLVDPGESLSVTVGAGGISTNTSNGGWGQNGEDSVFDTYTALGGGGGGNYGATGGNGGSGGGGGGRNSTAGGAGDTDQGHDGADASSYTSSGNAAGGGGGGYSDTGGWIWLSNSGSDGGSGTGSDITGETRWYAGGGGGGGKDGHGAGGQGGGGDGRSSDNVDGENGEPNTGGGGGGILRNATGGSGGSGIVVVRYTVAENQVNTIGDDTVHIYRETGSHNFTVPENVTEVEYLVIGGGGAGGSSGASTTAKGTGGGGAGAFRLGRIEVTPGAELPVIVGTGGSVASPDTSNRGEQGQDSKFKNVVASGGGGGGVVSNNGGSGGSGGGGGGRGDSAVGGDGIPGAGFSGGKVTGSTEGGKAAGGGGGGAGGAGEPGYATESWGAGGDGGPGLVSTITGSARWYAGGGGGGAADANDNGNDPDGGLGGLGGGGAGTGQTEPGADAEAGRRNTGGGGGGIGVANGSRTTLGGAGGSGIVVIRYSSSDDSGSGATVNISEIPQVTAPEAVLIPVQLSGFDGATDLVAFVRLDDNAGTLAITDTMGLSLEVGFDSFTDAQSIGFRGTRADVKAALADHLEWDAPLEAVEPNLSVNVTQAEPGTFYNPDNGHYYKVMNGGADTTWQQAKMGADGETLFGMTGYLATITSANENNFTANNTTGTDIWVGASDSSSDINAACGAELYSQKGEFGVSSGSSYDPDHRESAEGRWYWVAGPEACTQFWAGADAGSRVADRFARWADNEPNDYNAVEGYGGINRPDEPGRWNDFGNGTSSANDYLVEFGGLDGESSTALSANASRTLRAADQILVDPVDTATGTSASVPITLPAPLTNTANDGIDFIAGVSVPSGGGTLEITSTTGLTLSEGFAWSGETAINFYGARTNVEAALNSLEWSAPTEAGQVELTVSVSEYATDAFFNSVNGHYYKVFNFTNILWEDARDEAESKTLFGMKGYLATLTSQQENDFAADNTTGDNIWIGASDSRDAINQGCAESRHSAQASGDSPAEGEWYWVTGPEACTQFWRGLGSGSGGTTVNSEFASWDGAVEPNDNNGAEHFAGTNWDGTPGKWNDFSNEAGTELQGYLVEFGGRSNEANTSINAGGTGTLAASELPEAPTSVTAAVGNQQAEVSWTPGDDKSSPITQYTVSFNSGNQLGEACTAEPPQHSCSVDGLTNGMSYDFTVTATNARGTSPASVPSNLVTPESAVNITAPDGVTPVVNDDGSETTTYTNNNGDTVHATSYADNAGANSFTQEGTNGRTSTVLFDGGDTSTTINDDGSIASTNTTGNGTVTDVTVNNDGSIDYSQDGGVTTQTAPAGSEVRVDDQGNLTVKEETQRPLESSDADGSLNACYVHEDFNNGVLSGWSVLASNSFTPNIVEIGNSSDNNRLRLTDAGGNIATGITKDIAIPSTGKVELDFVAHIHGGSGADGLAVVLSDWGDASAPSVGANGGSLGYAQKNSTAGFSDGWLGIGIDEYGNFANSNEGRTGGPGFRRNAISLRGSGSGTTGYRYITGTNANLTPKIDNNYPGQRYLVTIDATNAGTGEVLVTVRRSKDLSDDYEVLLDQVNVLDGSGSQAPLPDKFRLSLTSSTGGATNFHELSSLIVSASNCAAVANPVVTTNSFSVERDDPTVGTLQADSEEQTSFFIDGGADANRFHIENGDQFRIDDTTTNGDYKVSIKAEDARGNVSNAQTVTVSVVTPEHDISVASAGAGDGVVSGGGGYMEGETVTVVADPSSGDRFVEWREAGSTVADAPDYTFTLEADRTLEAVFEPFSTTLTTPGGATQTAYDDGSETTSFVNGRGDVTNVTRHSDDSSANGVTVAGSNGRTSVAQFEGGTTSTTINVDGSVTSANTTNGVATDVTINSDGTIDYSQNGSATETAQAGSEVHVDRNGELTVFEEDSALSASELTTEQCYINDFDSGTLSGWTVLKSDNYTPQVVNVGGGRLSSRLRLTDNGDNRATGITKDVAIPTGGKVEVEFYAHAHGGSGADGIAVVLSDWGDGSQPIVGAAGGSLGYAQKTSTDGFTDGWLGIGIDDWGNYARASEGREGGPGFRSNAVSIRGSGVGTNGYRFIDGTKANLRPKIDNNFPGHRYLLVVDTSTPGQALVTVKRNRGREISGRSDNFETLIDAVDVLADSSQAALPTEFRLSITGSTGGATNFHEISKVSVSASNCTAVNPPTITTDSTSPLELLEGDTAVGTIAANSDSNEELSFFVAGGTHADQFAIDANSGELSFRAAAQPGTYNVEVAAEDVRGNTSGVRGFEVEVAESYSLSYTAGANGTIDGSNPQTVGHGNDGSAVTVVPNAGYHFVRWSDGSTENPRTDTNITGDLNLSVEYSVPMDKVANLSNDPDAEPLTASEYETLGVTGVDTNNLNAINTAVAASDPTDVDTQAKIQTLVNSTLNEIATVTDTITALPATADLALSDAADVEAARVDYNALTPEQQALVDDADLVSAETKIDELETEAALTAVGNQASDPEADPATVEDYSTAGVSNVDAENVDAINAAVEAADPIDVDTLAEIQTLVDSTLNEITTVTDTITALPATGDLMLADAADVEATRADYDALMPEQQALVDDSALADAETRIAELETEAALTAVSDQAGDPTADPATVEDYSTVGVTDVDAENLDAVNAAIAGADPTDVETVEQIQTLVDATLTDIGAVEDKISALPATDDLMLADAADVEATRADYDALMPEQQALVDDTALEAAETKMAELESAPHVINTPEDLVAIADQPDANYVLEGDIDLTGAAGLPIGSAEQPFTGSLTSADGKPAIITGLNGEPLFHTVGPGAEISNLTVSASVNTNAGDDAGLLANFIAGTEIAPALIDKVLIDAASSITGGNRVGGLAGSIDHADINDVIIDSVVTGENEVGGIGGSLANSDLSNIQINGVVNGTGNNVGGIGGNIDNATVETVTVDGNVSSDGDQVGGVGGIIVESEVGEVSVNGTVEGNNIVGGIVGSVDGGSITNSVVTGTVSGSGSDIGDIGGNFSGTIVDNVTMTGDNLSDDVEPLTIELLDEDGNALGDRPVGTGEVIRIPVSGGTQPLTITGKVTRGNITEDLIPGTEQDVLLVDGDENSPVLIQENGDYFFVPTRGGEYVLSFQDAEYRTLNVEFEVRPQVAFSSIRQLGTAGEQLVVRAVLEGDPAQYPVIVPYEVTGHDLLQSSDLAVSGEFQFTADGNNERIRTLAMTPGSNIGDVTVTLFQGETPEHALLGDPAVHRIVLRQPEEVPLYASVLVEQAGQPVETIVRDDDGPVTLSVVRHQSGVKFDAGTHSIDWSNSSLALGIHSQSSAAVVVDPTWLSSEDAYSVQVRVTEDSGATRMATAELRLRVVNDADAQILEAREDFVTDPQASKHRLAICPAGVDSFRDTDERTCNQIDRSQEGAYLEAPEGYTLSLGGMSEQASWSTGDFGLEVHTTEIVNDAGQTALNAEDDLFVHSGFRVDFELSDLDFPGQSVPLVVPLPDNEEIPDEAVWRKYLSSGWVTFVEDDANKLYSAPLSSGSSECPWPGSDRWEPALNPGHECVRLIIEDGGPNDWDGKADGVIRDPGTLATPRATPAPNTTTKELKSGGAAGGWLISLAILGLLARCRFLLAAIPILLPTMFSTAASASQDWYLGGTVGHTMTDVDSDDINDRMSDQGIGGSASITDDNDLGYKLFVGYQWNPWLAVEGGYTDLGEITTTFINLDAGTQAEDLRSVRPGIGYGAELALVGGYDVGFDLRGIARAGFFAWEAEHDLNGSSDNANGLDVTLGLGVERVLYRGLVARLSWDHYVVEGHGTHLLGLGLVYHFGGKTQAGGSEVLPHTTSQGEETENRAAPAPVVTSVAEPSEPEESLESDESSPNKQLQTEEAIIAGGEVASETTVDQAPLSESDDQVEPPLGPRVWQVRFAFDEHRFTGHREVISTVMKLMQAHGDIELSIVGYTDSSGPTSYNMELSKARAEAVAQALINLGLDSERLRIQERGEAEPIASNSTVEGRSMNRRVEIKIPDSGE